MNKTGNEVVKEAFDDFGRWEIENAGKIERLSLTQRINRFNLERVEAARSRGQQ